MHVIEIKNDRWSDRCSLSWSSRNRVVRNVLWGMPKANQRCLHTLVGNLSASISEAGIFHRCVLCIPTRNVANQSTCFKIFEYDLSASWKSTLCFRIDICARDFHVSDSQTEITIRTIGDKVGWMLQEFVLGNSLIRVSRAMLVVNLSLMCVFLMIVLINPVVCKVADRKEYKVLLCSRKLCNCPYTCVWYAYIHSFL